MTWVSVAVGFGTVGYGIYQSQSGKKKAEKAEQAIKQESTKANVAQQERMNKLKLAETMGTEAPGSQYEKNLIDATTSSQIASNIEGGNQANFQNMIAQSVLQQQQAYGELGARNQQFRQDRSQDVLAGLKEQVGLEEDVRQRNIDLQTGKLAEGLAEKEAGRENITGGAITGIMGASGGMGGGSTGGGSARTTNTTGMGGGFQRSSTREQRQGRRAERRYARR